MLVPRFHHFWLAPEEWTPVPISWLKLRTARPAGLPGISGSLGEVSNPGVLLEGVAIWIQGGTVQKRLSRWTTIVVESCIIVKGAVRGGFYPDSFFRSYRPRSWDCSQHVQSSQQPRWTSPVYQPHAAAGSQTKRKWWVQYPARLAEAIPQKQQV